MTVNETIDVCIERFKIDVKITNKVIENQKLYSKCLGGTKDKFNDATIRELNDDILIYQKHLDNLNKLKETLELEKIND